jgi:Flp pilus assembly protein TadD
LARDPQNSAALVDAGNAAMLLGDFDAAIGFFTRADQVRPGNGPIKAQIGSAMLNAGQPFDAISWFDQAEGAGADPVTMASDRGLAYDLIGDNTAAQRQYQRALSRGDDEEATRRYAISLAIAGDRRGAESILAPQIQRQDRPAWRVRTFIVAILGDTDEAVGIANASMPASLAQGVTPYLRYLPRLTPSQQAAAANLGRFPRAAEIGRDEPRVVQYALLHPRAPRIDSSLIPAGEALGGRGRQNDRDSRSKRGRGKRGSDTQIAAVTPARPPSPLMVTTPWGLQPRPPAPNSASIPGAPQAVPAAKPTVLSKLDLPPLAPRAASSGRTQPSTSVPSTPLPSTPVSRPPIPTPPLAETRTPIAALPVPNSVMPERTPPKAAAPSAPIVPLSAPSATMPETILPKAAALPEAPLSPPAQPLVPALSGVLADQAPPPPPVALQASPKPADPAPEQARDFGSAFMDFKPPTEEQQPQVAAVDLTTIRPARPRSAKSPQPDAIPFEAAAKEGKDTNGKAGKNGKNAADSKGNSKNSARGERPDGPTSVARISDADKEQADARTVKVSKGGKAEKDRKDAKDSKDSKAGKNAKSGLSHPSRIWVQVLTGANRDVMVKEWRNMVREAGGLKGRKPFTTPWRSNFRLLTGPFESDAAAQDFINGLRKDGVSGFQWTSPAGQAIDTLQLK